MHVAIAINRAGKRPFGIATVNDPALLVEVACAAIREARDRALSESDPELQIVHRHEAERLERTLHALMPELAV